MAQVTDSLLAEFQARVDRDLHINSTVGEEAQLLHGFREWKRLRADGARVEHRHEADRAFDAHCSYCDWKREDVGSLAQAKALAREHIKTCAQHPLNAERPLNEHQQESASVELVANADSGVGSPAYDRPGEAGSGGQSPAPSLVGAPGQRYPGCPVTEPGAKCNICEASCEGPWHSYPMRDTAPKMARQRLPGESETCPNCGPVIGMVQGAGINYRTRLLCDRCFTFIRDTAAKPDSAPEEHRP